SGAGKNSVLHALEDLGFEAVDNPPLRLVDTLIGSERPLAIGIDARTRNFSATEVIETINRLRESGRVQPELVFAIASPEVLLRRYTETRRRHPLAPQATVSDGIETEQALTRPLRDAANWVIDTSDLPLATLRQLVGQRFGDHGPGLSVTLVSFAFPAGLPREADLVFDARFLRNPHYIPDLRPRTGLDAPVRAYIEADPDYPEFLDRMSDLVAFLLPRFVQEGKKYATIAIGCTGGRHRSVAVVEALAARLRARHEQVRVEHRAIGVEQVETPPQAGRQRAEQTGPRTAHSGRSGVTRSTMMTGALK
ncbi:MAG TPA: RNase adapter RapZ, partial [Acidiphilium sp.]